MTSLLTTKDRFRISNYDIESIPTEWMGTLYKSRLEAKIARFLTFTNTHFQYEPEQIKLDDDLYTPDFYIENVYVRNGGENAKLYNVYLEVKPNRELAIYHDEVLLPKLSKVKQTYCFLLFDISQLNYFRCCYDGMYQYGWPEKWGGWADNCMGIQYDGKRLNFEFGGCGSYRWGNEKLTTELYNKAIKLSY